MTQYRSESGGHISGRSLAEQEHKSRDVGARMHNVPHAGRLETPLHRFTRQLLQSLQQDEQGTLLAAPDINCLRDEFRT